MLLIYHSSRAALEIRTSLSSEIAIVSSIHPNLISNRLDMESIGVCNIVRRICVSPFWPQYSCSSSSSRTEWIMVVATDVFCGDQNAAAAIHSMDIKSHLSLEDVFSVVRWKLYCPRVNRRPLAAEKFSKLQFRMAKKSPLTHAITRLSFLFFPPEKRRCFLWRVIDQQ